MDILGSSKDNNLHLGARMQLLSVANRQLAEGDLRGGAKL